MLRRKGKQLSMKSVLKGGGGSLRLVLQVLSFSANPDGFQFRQPSHLVLKLTSQNVAGFVNI